MDQQRQLFFIIGLLLLALGGAGCSLDNINTAGGSASGEEDQQAAAQILGESLSSDESGIILSLNDALTAVSENGFLSKANSDGQPGTSADRSGRGSETGYSHIYRPKTGVHIVTFKRQVQDALFDKTVTDSLRYQYHTSAGDNIEFPQRQSERIASIYYDARHEGQITTLHKQSHFVRQDTFLVKSLKTSTLDIDGVHHSTGSIKIIPAQNPSFERNYELEINLLNISAPAAAFNNNRDFWKNVSGTLSWQLKISHNANSRKMGGTIKLAGAGIAMLNFRSSAKSYQVNLNNGEVKDQDKEFEGRVKVVNLAERSVTLFNGRRLYLTSNTQIEQEDYTSLKAADNALKNDINIWAEGEGSLLNGRFTVTEVSFEQEDNEDDDADNQVEFDEKVTSVDAAAGLFTLAGKATIAVNKATVIEAEGDYKNLQEVAKALENGLQVSAEGEATPNSEAAKADFTAKDVKFEQVEPNDNDGEED